MGKNNKANGRSFAWLIGEFGILLQKWLTINNFGWLQRCPSGYKDARLPTDANVATKVGGSPLSNDCLSDSPSGWHEK